jgi:hypothetical protein
MKVNPAWVYRLNDAVAIEDFGERSLALHCVDLRLIELNATARDMLRCLDGQADLEQVSASMANDYGQPMAAILSDVQEIVTQMVELDLVERVAPASEEETFSREAERLYSERGDE